MAFDEVIDKNQWESKIASQNRAQFLQSWEWGEFQKSLGRKVWRFAIDDKLIQIIKMPLPFGQSYFYVPRLNFEVDDSMLNCLKLFVYREKGIFLRIEPVKQSLENFKFKKAAAVQPSQTLLLDLTKTEEQLLNEMHAKTRYNIRLAEKKGVKILTRTDAQALAEFYKLIANTYGRKGIHAYSQTYYQKLLESVTFVKLIQAEFEGKILCANLLVSYGDTMTYLHGGSSEADKNIMAPYLVQWEAIKMAKAQSFKYYDFWGINEAKWPGVTRFKKGFGPASAETSGFEVKYAGTFDLAIHKFQYWMYRLLKRFK